MVADFCGWVGAFATLAAYAAFSMGWITNGRLFQTCNLIGSAALIINGYHHGAWAFVVLNTVWGTISVTALIRLQLGRSNNVREVHPAAGLPGQASAVPLVKESVEMDSSTSSR